MNTTPNLAELSDATLVPVDDPAAGAPPPASGQDTEGFYSEEFKAEFLAWAKVTLARFDALQRATRANVARLEELRATCCCGADEQGEESVADPGGPATPGAV